MQHITQDTTQHIIHTEHSTQNAHRMHTHRIQNTDTTIMQHIHINTEQENTEQNTDTETNNPAHTPQQNSAHNYRTYSFDIYKEFAYIKNSNTIELYTILQE